MDFFWVLLLIGVGIVVAGYIYHRYNALATTVTTDVATVVNKAIDDVKIAGGSTVVTTKTTITANAHSNTVTANTVAYKSL